MAFDITAELQVAGPKNLNKVVSDIKSRFQSFAIDLKFSAGNLNKVYADIQRKLSNIKVNVGIKSNVNLGNATKGVDTLNKYLIQLEANAGRANTALGALSTTAKNFASISNNVSQSTNSVTNSVQKVSKATATAADEMTHFGEQAGIALRRFGAFTIATGTVFGFIFALERAIATAVKFDKEIVRLQQVTGFTRAGLKDITDEIDRLSTGFGVSSTELINVASTLKQAGLSAVATKNALDALAKSSLAPSFDSMNETVEGSIAIMRQFGISAAGLKEALGSVNTVAAEFAVESRDIITAVQIAGGAFAASSKGIKTGQESLEEFIALFTSVRQTTRESAESIATGLRTISTRLQRGSTINILKGMNIELQNSEGLFIGVFDAVKRLSIGLKGLDTRDPLFAKIGEELGGFRQISKVIPLIQQQKVAEEALLAAKRGQSSLDTDATIAQQAFANSLAKTREEFLKLVRAFTDSGTFRQTAQVILDATQGILRAAQSLAPAIPLFAGLFAIKSIGPGTRFVKGAGSKLFGNGGAVGGATTSTDVAPSTPKTRGSSGGIVRASFSEVTTAITRLTLAVEQNTLILQRMAGPQIASYQNSFIKNPAIGPGGLPRGTKVDLAYQAPYDRYAGAYGSAPLGNISSGRGYSRYAKNSFYQGNITYQPYGPFPLPPAAAPLTFGNKIYNAGTKAGSFIGRNKYTIAGAGALGGAMAAQSYLGNSSPAGAAVGGGLGGAATYGLLGASVGSFFPGAGTAIGGAIGAAGGALYGAYDSYQQKELDNTFNELNISTEKLINAFDELGNAPFKLEKFTDQVAGARKGLLGYAYGSEIKGAGDEGAAANLIQSRTNEISQKLITQLRRDILNGVPVDKLVNNKDFQTVFGLGSVDGSAAIAKDSRNEPTGLLARILEHASVPVGAHIPYELNREKKFAADRAKAEEELRKEGEKRFRDYVEIIKKEKEFIKGLSAIGTELDLLGASFEKLGALATRLSSEIEGVSASNQNNLNVPFGGGKVIARGGLSDIFSNPLAYSTDQVKSAGANFGNSPQTKALVQTFVQARILQEKLPKVIKDSIIEGRIAGYGKGEDSDAEMNQSSQDRIFDRLDTISNEDFGGDKTLTSKVKSALSELFSKQGKLVNPEDILDSDITKLFGELYKKSEEAVNKLAKSYDAATQLLVDSTNQLAQAQIRAKESVLTLVTTQNENRLSFAAASNREPSLDELFLPFRAQINQLGAGSNPTAIGANLTNLIKDRNKAQADVDAIPPEQRKGNPNFILGLNTVKDFDVKIAFANKALTLFASNVRESAVQTKLADLDRRSAGSRNIVETLLRGNGQDHFNIQRQAQAFAKFRATGQFGELPQERNAVLDFIQLISPSLSQDKQQELQKAVLKGFEGLVGKNALTDLGLEGIGTGGDERTRLLDQLNTIQGEQVTALTKLAEASSTLSTTFETTIPNQFAALLGKLDSLISAIGVKEGVDTKTAVNQPAVNKAAGGTIFKPQGTDTVPAMLTPHEFVVNAKQAKKHRGLLEKINAGYYATGGSVNSFEAGKAARRKAYEEGKAGRKQAADDLQAEQDQRGRDLIFRQRDYALAQADRARAPYAKSGIKDSNGETKAQKAIRLIAAANERKKKLDESRGIVNEGPSINGQPIVRKENKGPSINGVPIDEVRRRRAANPESQARDREYARKTGNLPVTVAPGTINGVPVEELARRRNRGGPGTINGVAVADLAKERAARRAGRAVPKRVATGNKPQSVPSGGKLETDSLFPDYEWQVATRKITQEDPRKYLSRALFRSTKDFVANSNIENYKNTLVQNDDNAKTLFRALDREEDRKKFDLSVKANDNKRNKLLEDSAALRNQIAESQKNQPIGLDPKRRQEFYDKNIADQFERYRLANEKSQESDLQYASALERARNFADKPKTFGAGFFAGIAGGFNIQNLGPMSRFFGGRASKAVDKYGRKILTPPLKSPISPDVTRKIGAGSRGAKKFASGGIVPLPQLPVQPEHFRKDPQRGFSNEEELLKFVEKQGGLNTQPISPRRRRGRRYAEGGSVDNIPAYLSEGEYVVSRKAMMANGGLVHAINRGQVRKYAAGGPVGSSNINRDSGGGYAISLDSNAQSILGSFNKLFSSSVDKMANAIQEFVNMDKKIEFEGTVKDIVVKVQGETEFANFVTSAIKDAVQELINNRMGERMNSLTGEPKSV